MGFSQTSTKYNCSVDEGSYALLSVNLRPHNSLDERSSLKLVICFAVGMTLPIIPFGNTYLFIGIAPFYAITWVLFYTLLLSNFRSRKYFETIRIWPNLIEINRYENNGSKKSWTANPFWTKIKLYPANQKVENYLTLTGNGREIEIGAFLAPSERLKLKQKIETTISNI